MYPFKSIISSFSKCARCGSSGSIIKGMREYHGGGFNSRRLREREEVEKEAQKKKDCQTLNLPDDCNDESQVRHAYISLAKKFHPDSGTSLASVEQFQKIDTAYKNLLKYFADFRHNRHKIEGEYGLYYQPVAEEDDEGPDIKHTAPQHRQYLSFGGIGSGTPAQRERQFNNYRRAKATEGVLEYRVQKLTEKGNEEEKALAKDTRASKKIKTGIGIERLVEDLIQESMAKGDFDNLSGKGKPLKPSVGHNPYIDFTTHKLNQVLIENGFAPEWIVLEKEIKQEKQRIRQELSILRHKYDVVLSEAEESEWWSCVDKFRKDCDTMNKAILKFNLTVPSLHKQMIAFQLDKEARKILQVFSPEMRKLYQESMAAKPKPSGVSNPRGTNDGSTLFDAIFSIFK